jgi:DNA-binding transcriptional LysR family regulator
VYARGILHQLEGVRQAVTGSEADPAGKVAIGLPPSLGQVLTVPLVKAFRARYRRGELAIPTVDFCESGADRLRLFYRLVLHGGKRWKSGCSGALE